MLISNPYKHEKHDHEKLIHTLKYRSVIKKIKLMKNVGILVFSLSDKIEIDDI